MKKYYTYILANKKNGTIYIGVTSDLIKRIWEHKQKLVPGFTQKYNIDKLVYCEEHNDVNLAIQREKQIKKWNRSWKIKIIKKQNPEWKDLYNDIIQL
jgi:putative endonuclease